MSKNLAQQLGIAPTSKHVIRDSSHSMGHRLGLELSNHTANCM